MKKRKINTKELPQTRERGRSRPLPPAAQHLGRPCCGGASWSWPWSSSSRGSALSYSCSPVVTIVPRGPGRTWRTGWEGRGITWRPSWLFTFWVWGGRSLLRLVYYYLLFVRVSYLLFLIVYYSLLIVIQYCFLFIILFLVYILGSIHYPPSVSPSTKKEWKTKAEGNWK